MGMVEVQIKQSGLAYFLLLLLYNPLSAANDNLTKGQKPLEFHWDFTQAKLDKTGIPEGWTYRGKLGTPAVKYELVQDEKLKHQVLKISSDKASGVIMRDASKLNLKKYSVMRWRWKAAVLPTGADATIKEKDDQGIAIYAGYGKIKQQSISYAWQTENTRKSTGHSVYNMLVNVDWITLRNKEDITTGWITEEVNLFDDMNRHFKKIPEEWAVSISSNSQYTGSKAEVYLDFIEFVPNTTTATAPDQTAK